MSIVGTIFLTSANNSKYEQGVNLRCNILIFKPSKFRKLTKHKVICKELPIDYEQSTRSTYEK